MIEILKKYGIKAKKSLGQNFLMDEEIVSQISQILPIQGKNIVEVGPGFGVLTQKILQHQPKSLTLVELDNDMVDILHQRIDHRELDTKNVDFALIHKDILQTQIPYESYYVIANIPYYITSPILKKFLYQSQFAPEKMLILMQNEVGERIVSNHSSVLSLFVQKKCTVQKEIFVPSKAFIPAPKVDSVVISFQKRDDFEHIDDELFLSFIKKSFINPRKKLVNNLSQFEYKKENVVSFLESLGFTHNTRGEELDIEQFISLFVSLSGMDKNNID